MFNIAWKTNHDNQNSFSYSIWSRDRDRQKHYTHKTGILVLLKITRFSFYKRSEDNIFLPRVHHIEISCHILKMLKLYSSSGCNLGKYFTLYILWNCLLFIHKYCFYDLYPEAIKMKFFSWVCRIWLAIFAGYDDHLRKSSVIRILPITNPAEILILLNMIVM